MRLQQSCGGGGRVVAILTRMDEAARLGASPTGTSGEGATWAGEGELTGEEVERYARQTTLPGFGPEAQLKLRAGAALVVGAGGLGSPVLLYLAGAGVGRLGIVDRDAVELSNLHRQIAHGTAAAAAGAHKADSAAAACRALNPCVALDVHREGLTPANALTLVEPYDVVVDCSDNAPTRYLINDACVFLGKPLVSAAAIGTEGQLSVYNFGDGPCYRCLFPEPPAAAHCQRCSEAGVLGVVPGVMGTLQALEAVKILGGVGEPLAQKLLLFDGLAGRFQTVKLRGRQPGCAACGDTPSVARAACGGLDPALYAGGGHCGPWSGEQSQGQQLLDEGERLSCKVFAAAAREPHLLLDVRPTRDFRMASLCGSVNIPLGDLDSRLEEIRRLVSGPGDGQLQARPLFVVCRRGNDSQRAVQVLRASGFTAVRDLIGGLHAWKREVDSSFPAC